MIVEIWGKCNDCKSEVRFGFLPDKSIERAEDFWECSGCGNEAVGPNPLGEDTEWNQT